MKTRPQIAPRSRLTVPNLAKHGLSLAILLVLLGCNRQKPKGCQALQKAARSRRLLVVTRAVRPDGKGVPGAKVQTLIRLKPCGSAAKTLKQTAATSQANGEVSTLTTEDIQLSNSGDAVVLSATGTLGRHQFSVLQEVRWADLSKQDKTKPLRVGLLQVIPYGVEGKSAAASP